MRIAMLRTAAEKAVARRLVTIGLLSALLWTGGLHRAEAGVNEWTTNGPEAGAILALAIDPLDPATVYAAAGYGTLFKTEDGGETWTAPSFDLIGLYVSDVAIDPLTPSTLYVGTGGSGVFRSTDGGGTWSAIGPPVPGPTANLVVVDPVTPTTLYAAVRCWLMKSVDDGATWIYTYPGCDYINDVAIDPRTPSTIYAGIFRATPSGGGLSKSLDGGETWDLVTWELLDPMTRRRFDVGRVVIDPVDTSIVYISTSGGAFKSTNGGGGWTPIQSGLDGVRVDVAAIDPVTTTTLYSASGTSGVFKSTDGGGTWSALNQGLTDVEVRSLAIDPRTPGTVYAATDSGVFVIQQEEAPPANGAPHADAGPDQAVEATGPDGALVTLDGSGSTDPDGDPLAFAWSWPTGGAGGDRPAARLPLGTTTVALTVSDPHGATGTDTVEITVRDTTPPEVALSAPEEGATVTGTINVAAVATDAVGVAGVQFLLDGEPLGPEDTSAPREVPWDTRTASDGTHALSARARDAAGHPTTSATVTVTVANGPIPALALARSEEHAATLAPPAAWTKTTNEETGVILSGSEAAYASAAGATATFTFTGTGVKWLGFPCERCGVAEVFIDGARVATVDTYFPGRPELWQVMYTSPRLAAGTHTLLIQVTGTANTASAGAFVVIDAFEPLLDGAGVLPPVSTDPSGLLGGLP
jgi:photosystem II stability/assembly factor-like uncharacterized protein